MSRPETEMNDPDAVLQLKPRRWKYLSFLSMSCVFCVVGVLLLIGDCVVAGVLMTVFFGLASLVFALSLMPGSVFLRLEPEDMTIRSLYRTWRVRRSDISAFFVARIGGREMVCWDYLPTYAGQRHGRAFSRGLTGVEAGLPDTYGRSAGELADLLNAWRAASVDPPPGKSAQTDV
ncbi:MAG: hypothetical protein LBF93_09465 [Zoogloeaceae bacterium]|jgi:hypothetical protein|nr:hypothetical protein [Zoogloeaceae bacterium]